MLGILSNMRLSFTCTRHRVLGCLIVNQNVVLGSRPHHDLSILIDKGNLDQDFISQNLQLLQPIKTAVYFLHHGHRKHIRDQDKAIFTETEHKTCEYLVVEVNYLNNLLV